MSLLILVLILVLLNESIEHKDVDKDLVPFPNLFIIGTQKV